MTMRPVVILRDDASRAQAVRWCREAADGYAVEFRPAKRSHDQNRLLHARIADVAARVEWHGRKLGVEAWKDIFTAALRSANHQTEIVPGIDGGFVLLGNHTSTMSVAEVNDLITLIEAFGSGHGVTFRAPPGTEAMAA